MKPNLSNHLLASLLVSTLCLSLSLASSANGQFLFTYEINQEDDSRAPKSSLFDPSSFRIVTPSQLQNSYQKLSTQPIEVPSSASGVDESGAPASGENPPPPPQQHQLSPVMEPAASARPQPNEDPSSSPASSLLKQTSTALQSFAELFSLSPSSSPSPLGGNGLAAEPQVDQQAEARSLHEHWTQQQQKSHQSLNLNPNHNQLQQQQELNPSVASSQQASLANAALNSFTTTPTSGHLHQAGPQHSPQASYWLTASPLNPPDGNYLVQVRQPQSSSPANSVVDNLLSLAHRNPAGPQPSPFSQAPRASGPKQSAQSSFLSTPTSYYPAPNAVESSTRVAPVHHQQLPEPASGTAHRAVPMDHFGAPAAPVVPAAHRNQQQQQQQAFAHTTAPSRLSLRELSADQQLQPPANAPENYQPQTVGVLARPAAQQPGRPTHKSAEQSLISYRNQQHEQQNALFAAQQQFANQQQAQPEAAAHQFQPQAQHVPQTFHQPASQQQQQPAQASQDIPKVSPQIYESFLLQQRDQHEKHMELLKQQQELNKLLEQKHKQQEAELKRKRKKEELDKEARKKALRELELARKLKLEQEERDKQEALRRRRDEEDRKRAAEERRYRDYLEAREREAAQLKRQAEEELEQKQRAQKERDEALQEKRKREEEAAKYANYLRQQEELKKLIELKQKEDDAQQQRRRQVAAALQQQQQQAQQPQKQPQSKPLHSGRPSQRAGSAGSSNQWGTPLRLRGQSSSSTTSEPQVVSAKTTESPIGRLTGPISSTTAAASEPSTAGIELRPRARARQVVMVRQKLRNSAGDDKLIRQKIPNYTGPGQYGLYRGANDSIAHDLAALLDSVTLPTSTAAPSATTGAATPATSAVTPSSESLTSRVSSSLSPLLVSPSLPTASAPAGSEQPSEPFFDDDVPRRPARGLSQGGQRRQAAGAQTLAVSSSRPQPSRFNESSASGRSAHIGLASLPADSDNDGIPGRAGVEYPILSSVPPTSFSCSKQPLNGYYADTETACQVVHLCQAGTQSSILCPNGTIFNQEKFSCQWWYEVNCSRAPIFYQLNDNLYKATALPPADESSSSASESKRKLKNKERGSNQLSV